MLADGFSLEFEWQQVSSSFQDSSQDSGCSLPSLPGLLIILWHNRHFHVPQLFQFSSKVEELILRFTFLQIYLWSAGTAKSTILKILFFLLIIIRSGLLAGIWWSVCMLKSNRSLCVSFFRMGAGLCIYHLLVWSNINFLHISQWITLPNQSCLALYSFCANLLHSLIMWLIVSSLSLHSLHLLFCCVLSILALIWLILMALSCAAIRWNSVSLLRFPFLSQVQVFWWEKLFISHLKRLL